MSIRKQSFTIQFPSSNQQIIIPAKFSNENDQKKEHHILSKIHLRKTRTQPTQQSEFHRLLQSKAKQLLFAQSQANTSFESSQFKFAGQRYTNKNNLIHYQKDHQISAFKSVQPCYHSIKPNISYLQSQEEKAFLFKPKIKMQPTVQQEAYWNKRNHQHPVFRPAVLNPTFSIPLSKHETRLILMSQNKLQHNEEGVNLDKFNDAMKQFALRTQGLCMSNGNCQQQSHMDRKKKKISQLSKKVMKARCKSLNSIQQQYQKQQVLSDIQKHQTRCLLNLRIKKLGSNKNYDNDRYEEMHFMKQRQNSNQYPIPILGLSDEDEISKSVIRLKNKSKSCAVGQFTRCQNKKLAVMKILSKMARAKVEENSSKKKPVPSVTQSRPSDFLRSIKLKIHQNSKDLSEQKDKKVNQRVRKQIDKTVKQFCTKMKTQNLVLCSLMKNNVSSHAKQFLPNS